MTKTAYASGQAQDCTCPLHATDRRHVLRAQQFAGRLLAEGYGPEATDEEMQAAFAGCVRPVSSDYYPLIRLEALRIRVEPRNA